MDFEMGHGGRRAARRAARVGENACARALSRCVHRRPGRSGERPSGSAGLLAERDLLCLSWPEEFGGGGASVWEQTVVREEMWAHHEPRGAQYMGVNWVGPIIMRHGTAEQQRKHLPPIARGEVIWCQGFSEPEAGSDLASLRTAARRDGDGWLVSGQKIWTSYATMAQWCFLLARTTVERARKNNRA